MLGPRVKPSPSRAGRRPDQMHGKGAMIETTLPTPPPGDVADIWLLIIHSTPARQDD